MRRLRKLPGWGWLVLLLIVIELGISIIWWWSVGEKIKFTDPLTLLLLVVTTVYVGLTYGLLAEAHELRIVQFHPALEHSFFGSVDPFEHDLPETRGLVQEYLSQVSPELQPPDSNIVLRYENLRIKNVGQGQISKLTLGLRVSVPGLPAKTIRHELRPYLRNQGELLLTLFPFIGLSRYRVDIIRVEYSDYFGSYDHSHGPNTREVTLPYQIPPGSRKTIFYDDFFDAPFGKGWQLDYWRTANRDRISDQIRIENGQMRFTGDENDFRDRHHNHGVSFIDLNGRLKLGRSYEVRCRARSEPGTTARFYLWCHDIHPEGGSSIKTRHTAERTPATDWEDIRLVYTATQTRDLRIHLRYFPGQGTIYVDEVKVFEIQE